MADKNVRERTEAWFESNELTTCPNCGRARQITTAGGVTYCFGCEHLTSPLPAEPAKAPPRR